MDWYHDLTSPARVRENLCTLWSTAKLWVSIQSIALGICVPGSCSGLPENSGLKYDQFIAMDAGGTTCGSTGGITGCCCSYGSILYSSPTPFTRSYAPSYHLITTKEYVHQGQ